MNKICLLLSSLLATLTGCAFDIVHVEQFPVELEKANTIRPDFELTDEVKITLKTGYSMKLNKGTEYWKNIFIQSNCSRSCSSTSSENK